MQKNIRQKPNKCFLKNYRGSIGWLRTFTIEVRQLEIFLRGTQILEVLRFFKKKSCIMTALKLSFSNVTLLVPDNLSGL